MATSTNGFQSGLEKLKMGLTGAPHLEPPCQEPVSFRTEVLVGYTGEGLGLYAPFVGLPE